MVGIVDDRGAVVEEVHHEMNKVCTGLAFLWLELIERKRSTNPILPRLATL